MSDDKITTTPQKTIHSLADLETFAKDLAHGGNKESANQAMTLQYLVSSLRANVDRDVLMANMAARFDELEKRYNNDAVLHSEAYQALLYEFRNMQAMQAQLQAQQMHLAAIIDVGFDQISEVTERLQKLNAQAPQPALSPKSDPKP